MANRRIQGAFPEGVDIRAMCNAGLLPQSNFILYDRQTKAVEQEIRPLAIQAYVMPRLLTPTPISFFEPAREWHKEKEMGMPELSMSMRGRSKVAPDLESKMVRLPGFTENYGFSWREMGIAERTGRPLDRMTSRRAILKVMKAANQLGFDGDAGGEIPGLLAEVDASTIQSAAAVWSDATNSRPFEDINNAIGKVGAQDIDVSGFNVAIHPTNWAEAARVRTGTTANDQQLIRQMTQGKPEDGIPPIRIVLTTAVPEGTILGVPKDPVHADLLTTGLPEVIAVEANALWMEWQVRQIAVPRVDEKKALFKITGA